VREIGFRDQSAGIPSLEEEPIVRRPGHDDTQEDGEFLPRECEVCKAPVAVAR